MCFKQSKVAYSLPFDRTGRSAPPLNYRKKDEHNQLSPACPILTYLNIWLDISFNHWTRFSINVLVKNRIERKQGWETRETMNNENYFQRIQRIHVNPLPNTCPAKRKEYMYASMTKCEKNVQVKCTKERKVNNCKPLLFKENQAFESTPLLSKRPVPNFVKRCNIVNLVSHKSIGNDRKITQQIQKNIALQEIMDL